MYTIKPGPSTISEVIDVREGGILKVLDIKIYYFQSFLGDASPNLIPILGY